MTLLSRFWLVYILHWFVGVIKCLMQLEFTCVLFHLSVSYQVWGLDYRKNTIRFSVKWELGKWRWFTFTIASIGWHRMLFKGHQSILLIASDSSPVCPSILALPFSPLPVHLCMYMEKVHGGKGNNVCIFLRLFPHLFGCFRWWLWISSRNNRCVCVLKESL